MPYEHLKPIGKIKLNKFKNQIFFTSFHTALPFLQPFKYIYFYKTHKMSMEKILYAPPYLFLSLPTPCKELTKIFLKGIWFALGDSRSEL